MLPNLRNDPLRRDTGRASDNFDDGAWGGVFIDDGLWG